MEPTWTIIDREFHGPPEEWTRDYLEELILFEDYVQKKKGKAGTETKAKKK